MAVARGQGWLPQSPGRDLVREPTLYTCPAGRMCQIEHLLPGGVGGDVEEQFTPVRKEIIFVLGGGWGDPSFQPLLPLRPRWLSRRAEPRSS